MRLTFTYRENWCKKKQQLLFTPVLFPDTSKQLRFDDVVTQSSAQNCTVYCGGIQSGLSGKFHMFKMKLFRPVISLY